MTTTKRKRPRVAEWMRHRYVTPNRTLTTKGGTVFAEGERLLVTSVYRGRLTLQEPAAVRAQGMIFGNGRWPDARHEAPLLRTNAERRRYRQLLAIHRLTDDGTAPGKMIMGVHPRSVRVVE